MKAMFKFYFLKEDTRIYEKSDLITFLQATPNITLQTVNDTRYFLYHHAQFNFDARFVMANTACVPNIDRLGGNYYDVNFYVEFSHLLSNFCVEILLDIIEEIVRRFKFIVYHQQFTELGVFRRSTLLHCFYSYKRWFASKYPEEVANYNKLDPQAISQVYTYIQSRQRIEMLLDADKIQISEYVFLRTERSRTAWVAIEWDGETPFLLPPSVDILRLSDGKIRKDYPMTQVLEKAGKLFVAIDGTGLVRKLDGKNVKKLYKVLTKERFAPEREALLPLTLDKIIDI